MSEFEKEQERKLEKYLEEKKHKLSMGKNA